MTYEISLPEVGAAPVGYAALIRDYELRVPSPLILSAIGVKHKKYETPHWRVFTPRHTPEDSLYGHLVFALRYEGIDLSVLSALFYAVSADDIRAIIRHEPTGAYARRIWFLYEHTHAILDDITDADRGNYIDVLDAKLQYPGPPRLSKRHRVRNNLPGVADFCPLIRRTPELERFIAGNSADTARKAVGAVHPDMLLRAASFLLLEDSKASYAIEGETPPLNRTERWGRIIGQAGKTALSREELERLQREVIADTRFIHMGYRREGGFIGTHDRTTNMPVPAHISAHHDDIERLIQGMTDTAALLKDSDFPPVLAAAAIAFGFVFIHPFEDGNGRLHRYILHHILAETGFTPEHMVFPVSSVILKRIGAYRNVLESYSAPRLPFIEWRATEKGNVEILNDTIDLYRFFDATPQALFLYACVEETINHTLPEEIAYLERYDAMKLFVNHYIDMPDRMADLLICFLTAGKGILSKRAKEKEFAALSDAEIQTLERRFCDIFEYDSIS